MLRTILVLLWVPLYLIFSVIVYIPMLKLIALFSKEKEEKTAMALIRGWGQIFVGLTGNKVEIIEKEAGTFEKLKDEPIVIIANHQSNLDIPLLTGFMPKKTGFVAKKEMETWPILGRWMKRLNCVFLDRSDPRKAVTSIKEAVGYIKQGHSVVIFPEGTRSEDGNIGEFKKGSFKLATDSGVKIIPVTIKGTHDALKKGSPKIRKIGTLKIIADKPIDLTLLSKEEQKELPDKIRNIIIENFKN